MGKIFKKKKKISSDEKRFSCSLLLKTMANSYVSYYFLKENTIGFTLVVCPTRALAVTSFLDGD